ncbi:MAG: hypothetical protein V1784_03155, partial [bacterium]
PIWTKYPRRLESPNCWEIIKMPSGGARPNTGGKRAGSGRKPKVLVALEPSPAAATPLDVLLAIMRDAKADQRVRFEAAKAAAPYLHAKVGEAGKKGERQAAAAKVAAGKFAPAAPPRLVVNNAK